MKQQRQHEKVTYNCMGDIIMLVKSVLVFKNQNPGIYILQIPGAPINYRVKKISEK